MNNNMNRFNIIFLCDSIFSGKFHNPANIMTKIVIYVLC
ncbi:hypothetical protein VRK_26920 [Vibrio sp. MEBiC08052]|nr:hypothetical protein VRK_26920 [Vibrio sp. MEBiC08052]